jgi:hypothetical protein
MSEALQDYLENRPERIKGFYVNTKDNVQFIQVENHDYIWAWIDEVISALNIEWDPPHPLHELSTDPGSYAVFGAENELVLFFADETVLIENRLAKGHPAIFDRIYMAEPEPEDQFFEAAEGSYQNTSSM